MDENVETSLEGKFSVKQFPTIIGRSKSGVHPILITGLYKLPGYINYRVN
jgi:thioredoxin-related protein